MPPRKLYFEAVRIGDELTVLPKAPIDRVQLSRYAGATGDHSPIFVDEAFARASGMPSVLAPGSLGMAFLAQLVTDWARGATVRRISARFVRTLWPEDTLVCKGRVSDREGHAGRYLVELDVWAENQRGELVVRGQVALQVFYSLEDEARARAGQSPVVVEVPRRVTSAAAPVRAAPARSTTSQVSPRSTARARPAKPAPRKAPARAAGKRR
jgi:acyl dehydratase